MCVFQEERTLSSVFKLVFFAHPCAKDLAGFLL